MIAALVIVALGALLVLLIFWPERCPKGRRHDWGTPRPTLTGWAIVTCRACGEKDLT